MGWIKELGEQIEKVFTVKVIVIILFIFILIWGSVQVYRTGLESLPFVKFTTPKDTITTQPPSPKIKIEKWEHGDLLSDSAIKYEYHNVPLDSNGKKK